MQHTTNGSNTSSWSNFAVNGDAQSRNLAAIALAEAMDRARSQASSSTPFEALHATPVASPRQRLQTLRLKLEALYSAIPQDVEGIDLGHVREDRPRLYLDMIAHVDLGPDGRTFRLVQDGRNGGQILHETADETAMIARVTDYIAHRLILRERALESGDPVVANASHFSRGVSAATAMHEMQLEEERSHDLRIREAKEPVQAQSAPVVAASVVPASPAVKSDPVEKAPTVSTVVDESIRMNPAVETLVRQTAHQAADVETKLADIASAVNKNLEASPKAEASAKTEVSAKAVAEVISPVVVTASSSLTQPGLLQSSAAVHKAVSEPVVREAIAEPAAVGRYSKTLSSSKVTPVSKSSGVSWWLWPTLAVLLGMAFGAYLLYLYAMNFTV